MSIHMSVYMSTHTSIHMSVYMSTHTSIHMSIYMSIHMERGPARGLSSARP